MLRALGRITVVTPGILVRVTFNRPVPTARFPTHAVLFQRDVAAETGFVYVMEDEEAVRATRVGVLAILAAPTINILPSFSATITSAPNGLNMANYFIDADVGGEGCIVSIVRQ